ncbi:phage scaffolding protein [Cohnella cellulosilytica]|uniref:phage scaffolding protein n=1 Tax=Cohnella cellulosilytica TaxID=986710 RepID=UPI00366E290B
MVERALKKLGVAEADVDKIDAEVVKELPKHFVAKTQYTEVVEARKKAEKEVSDRDKQLEDLKKSSGDAAELTKKIETLQTENKAAKEKYEAEAKELRLGTAVKLALAGKVHDPDIVAGLLDKTKIELDDNGNIKTGLDDQIKALQTSKAFCLFPRIRAASSSSAVPILSRAAAQAAVPATKLLNLANGSPILLKEIRPMLTRKNLILEADRK